MGEENFPHQAIIREQLPDVEQILRNETWYEGERRHCPVETSDPVVQAHVFQIVMQKGHDLRRRALDRLSNQQRQNNG